MGSNRKTKATLLLIVLALTPAPSRADQIDLGLLKQGHEIMQYVESRKDTCKTVGVLRFEVQKGAAAPRYDAGPLNGNMATRLENLILMYQDPREPIQVIRDASAVAAARAPQKRWSSMDPGARMELFTHEYPLAWGQRPARPDLFLTGIVRLSADMRTATVGIYAFDSRSDPQKVLSFDVPTDRTILAEAGQSFSIPKERILARGGQDRKKSLADLMDEEAAESARQRDQAAPVPPVPPAPSPGPAPTANDYVELVAYYGANSHTPKADGKEGGELRLPRPPLGQSVFFGLRNKTPQKIAVVFYLNGKSTREERTEPAEQCPLLVLPPSPEYYKIDGFLDRKMVYSPFRVVERGDEAVRNELAGKLGLIEVFVFVEGPELTEKERTEVNQRQTSLRSLSPAARERAGLNPVTQPESAKEARDQMLAQSGLKLRPVPRGSGDYIVKDPKTQVQRSLEVTDFANPLLVGAPLVIRYNDPPMRD